MNILLKPYITITNFISGLLGKNSEVILYEVFSSIPDKCEVVYIKNNCITGKQIGTQGSDFLMEVAKNSAGAEGYSKYCAIDKYGKNIVAATMPIIFDNRLIGILSVNTEDNNIYKIKNLLEEVSTENSYSYTYDNSVDPDDNLKNSVVSSIEEVAFIIGKESSELTQEDKLEFVRQLYKKGVFFLKGSISCSADFLNVSAPTVYRYLKIVKNEF